MLATLDEIVQRLVNEYEPDRIIVFGSTAHDRATDGSDLDLLVVKETEQRPTDRHVEVHRILQDREIPIDLLVFTPAELRALHAMGNAVIDEIMESGKVVYMRKTTEAWLSESDEAAHIAALLEQHSFRRGALWHAQQAVDKALKVYLIEQGLRPGRTHDVVELRREAVSAGWSEPLATEEAIWLSSVYRGRYPTEERLLPHGEPTEQEVRRAVATARDVVEGLRLRVGQGRDRGLSTPVTLDLSTL
jgi:uncharacterized protein